MSIRGKHIRILAQGGCSIEMIATLADAMAVGPVERVIEQLLDDGISWHLPAPEITASMLILHQELQSGHAVICGCAAREQRHCRCGGLRAARWIK